MLKWLRNSSADEPGEKSGKGLKSGQGESVEERIQSTLDKIKAAEEEDSVPDKGILLLGVEPTYPSSKYGYIIP